MAVFVRPKASDYQTQRNATVHIEAKQYDLISMCEGLISSLCSGIYSSLTEIQCNIYFHACIYATLASSRI